MSPGGQYLSPEEVQGAIREIKHILEAQDHTYTERRYEDDEREKVSRMQREELLRRVDEHGKRTTVLEVKHEAFFGVQGAYQHLVKKMDENAAKQEKMFWMLFAIAISAVGVLLKSVLHL